LNRVADIAVLLFLMVFSAVWTFIAIMPQER